MKSKEVIDIIDKAVRENCNIKELKSNIRERLKSDVEGEERMTPEIIFIALCDSHLVPEDEVKNYMCWKDEQYAMRAGEGISRLHKGFQLMLSVREGAKIDREDPDYSLAIQYSMTLRSVASKLHNSSININDFID